MAGDEGATTGQLGLGHTAEDMQAMFTAAVLASTPPGSVALGQPADGSSEGESVGDSPSLCLQLIVLCTIMRMLRPVGQHCNWLVVPLAVAQSW